MANQTGTWIWGGADPDTGTAPSEPRTAPPYIKSLESRRLGLLVIFTFCAITGARPVVACSVRQTTSEALEWATPSWWG